MFDSSYWTPENLAAHSIDSRQFLDFRLSTLPNGMRIVDAYNASGLNFTILPDRGLDIWTAHYKGIPLTWISQGSPFAPDFGQSWPRQFNGGLLTTCGLMHVGPPEVDDVSGEERDLHGRYSRLRAGDLNIQRSKTQEITLTSSVSESILFGEQLHLTRTYRLTLDKPQIEVFDTVVNLGDLSSPLMVLYHVNPGYPLVSAGARLHAAHGAVYARDADASKGIESWDRYEAATARYPEQVFFHHVKQTPDEQARQLSLALLANDGLGLAVEWDTSSMPLLCQWKNTRQGIYVCGVEPCTAPPIGQNALRRSGSLMMLEPGQSIDFYLRLTVLEGASAIDHSLRQLDRIRREGALVEAQGLETFR